MIRMIRDQRPVQSKAVRPVFRVSVCRAAVTRPGVNSSQWSVAESRRDGGAP